MRERTREDLRQALLAAAMGGVGAILGACWTGAHAAAPQHQQTIPWFATHRTARLHMLHRCHDDARVGHSAVCENAELGETRDWAARAWKRSGL